MTRRAIGRGQFLNLPPGVGPAGIALEHIRRALQRRHTIRAHEGHIARHGHRISEATVAHGVGCGQFDLRAVNDGVNRDRINGIRRVEENGKLGCRL